MDKQDHMKIGRYRTWMEDGTLKLYGHEVGSSTSTICNLKPEEALGLLEMLSRHREEINHALYLEEHQHDTQAHW